jgi:transposase-like protein
MNVIKTNLNNFLVAEDIMDFLSQNNQDFMVTYNNVIQYANDVFCPNCGNRMIMNGFNRYGSEKIAKIKTQRYRCTSCKTNHEMKNDLIYTIISKLMETVTNMILNLRSGYNSYELIAKVLEPIIELSPDTIRNIFEKAVDKTEIDIKSDFEILHYDEQHPKKGRTQKYRLSLLDGKTRQMIKEELVDELDHNVVKDFLDKNLPRDKIMFIVTDLLPWYCDLLENIRPGKIIHQHCILHLNKLIVKEFHRNCSLKDELVKYRLLNIFYDRTEEIEYLQHAEKREIRYKKNHDKGYNKWLLDQRKDFQKFVRMMEKKRRRECKKAGLPDRMKMWSIDQARSNLDDLLRNLDRYGTPIQSRIKMIERDWERLTQFYRIEGAPATNNPIENYYSCSCKQIKKKQHRRSKALLRQWKLYAMKRAGMLEFTGMKFFEIYLLLLPFRCLS